MLDAMGDTQGHTAAPSPQVPLHGRCFWFSVTREGSSLCCRRQDAASLNHNAVLPLAKSQSDIQWSAWSRWRHLIKLQSLYTSTNIVRENNSTPLTFLQIGFVESILFTLTDICFSVNYPTWLFFSLL